MADPSTRIVLDSAGTRIWNTIATTATEVNFLRYTLQTSLTSDNTAFSLWGNSDGSRRALEVEKANEMLLAAGRLIETMRSVVESLKKVDEDLALRSLAALETYDHRVIELADAPAPVALFWSS